MSEFQLATPVAFIIFNRPDTTELVFSEIAKAKPKQLFIIGDGARKERLDEESKVIATRDIIKKVDWDCKVVTNFSDSNLGCKKRVSSGLDWLFNQVDEAIILEDDCLPDATFFRFCQEMLEYYKNESRIGMISGDNFQFGNREDNHSYYFSKYTHIWGWATWRDRWIENYDVNISYWPEIRKEGLLFDVFKNKREVAHWQSIFDRVYIGDVDTWDYQWVLTNLVKDRLNVIPAVNLISNIGFNENATHTTGSSELANVEREPMEFPLSNPATISQNFAADKFTYTNFIKKSLLKIVINKIVTSIKLLFRYKI